MKKLTLTLFLSIIGSVGFAQETKINGLTLGLEKAKTDSCFARTERYGGRHFT
jgi:hypothetical protein